VLAGVLTIRELKDGEVLLPEGSRDSNLHVIVAGHVEVVQMSKVMRAIMRVAHRVQRRLSLQLREMEHYIYQTGAKFVAG
jgi:hypothetical protein